VADHPRDLALVGGAVADERLLRDRRRELDDLGPERRRAGQGHPAPFADPQRGLHVARGESAFDDDDGRPDPLEDRGDPALDLAQALRHARPGRRPDRPGVEVARAVAVGQDRPVPHDPRPRVDPEDDRPGWTGDPAPERHRGDPLAASAVRQEPGRREHPVRQADRAARTPRRKGFLPHRAGPYALPARRGSQCARPRRP